MFRRRLYFTMMLVFLAAASFTAGYFTISNHINNKEAKENKTLNDAPKASAVIAKASESAANELISVKTKVIKNYRYFVDEDEVFVDKLEETAGADILGMNRSDAERYFKNKGFRIIGYSGELLEVSQDIHGKWPIGFYVVKSDGDAVKIYSVNGEGNLDVLESTDLSINLLPEGDKLDIIKGKVYKTLDEAKTYVEEDLSS